MKIQEVTFDPKTYILWRKIIPITDVSKRDTWDKAFSEVGKYVKSNDLGVIGPGSALYFSWDEKEGKAEIGIGLPISGSGEVKDPNLSLFSVPESKAIHATLNGSYEGLKTLHSSISDYVTKQKLTPSIVIEEYTTDPSKKTGSKRLENGCVLFVCVRVK